MKRNMSPLFVPKLHIWKPKGKKKKEQKCIVHFLASSVWKIEIKGEYKNNETKANRT